MRFKRDENKQQEDQTDESYVFEDNEDTNVTQKALLDPRSDLENDVNQLNYKPS